MKKGIMGNRTKKRQTNKGDAKREKKKKRGGR